MGQRGSQSRGAQEQCGIGGALSFGYFSLREIKKSSLPRVSHPQVLFLSRPQGAREFLPHPNPLPEGEGNEAHRAPKVTPPAAIC